MKYILILLILSLPLTMFAQRTSVRGYRYEKTIKNGEKILSQYTKGNKKLYVLWRPSKVLIYPNPSAGMVFFSEYGDAILRDVTGRILRIERMVSEMDLTGYAAGTYYITVITRDFVSHHIQVKI